MVRKNAKDWSEEGRMKNEKDGSEKMTMKK